MHSPKDDRRSDLNVDCGYEVNNLDNNLRNYMHER